LREEMFNSLEVQYMKDVEETENFDDPMYQELLKKLYAKYVTRHPKVSHMINTMATDVYNYFQGNNEFVMVGTLNDWSVRARLAHVTVCSLLTFGAFYTMALDLARCMHDT